jgi:hypothetical protein
VVDGLWATALTLVYGRSVGELFHGVAATALGRTFEMGPGSVLLGVAIHFAVAFWWAAVFLALVLHYPRLRARLSKATGVTVIAALYGPFIWVAMSVAVIPLRTGVPVSLSARWWIQLIGHAMFVGVPIVGVVARTPSRSAHRRTTAAPHEAYGGSK